MSTSIVIQADAGVGCDAKATELDLDRPGTEFTRLLLRFAEQDRLVWDDITILISGTTEQQLDVCSTIATALNDWCETLAKRISRPPLEGIEQYQTEGR